MTVSTELNWVSFTGGVTPLTVFALPFKFYDVATIYAQLDGQDLVQGLDYTVGGVGEMLTGTVTLAVFLAQDSELYVERKVPYLQEVDLQGQGSFLPETHEDALDILEFQIQQLVTRIEELRAIVVAAGNLIYDLACYSADAPGNAAVIGRWSVARTVSFPANMGGSKATGTPAATAQAVFLVKKNGTQVATITWAAAGTVATFSGSAWSVLAGDIVTLEGPATADASLAGIAVTMIGTRST